MDIIGSVKIIENSVNERQPRQGRSEKKKARAYTVGKRGLPDTKQATPEYTEGLGNRLDILA